MPAYRFIGMGGAMGKSFLVFFALLSSVRGFSQPNCQVLTSQGRPSTAQNDEFYQMIKKSVQCPQNIGAVEVILGQAFQNRKFMVGNRGRNNSKLGSFSIFEAFSLPTRLPAADAGIFLGHFTRLKSSNAQVIIDLDQAPDKDKLVIELIAWDAVKGYYNFYELIGQGTFNQWFYRGDSKDILNDNQFIYLNSSPLRPPIGQTLRCSGCHISGGPIMKELEFPHNDWWIKSRPLVFQNPLSEALTQRVRSLDSAENLSSLVKAGIQKLDNSPGYQAAKASLGIHALLRPLFCDLEINLESDSVPAENSSVVQIPSSSLAGPFAGPFKFQASKGAYLGLLQKYKMQFPETSLLDSDHAWLTPVKGYSDLVAIGRLKMSGLVDDKTILDIYFSSTVGSLMNKEKCNLLKLVPNSMEWKSGFLQNLKGQGLASSSTVAKSVFEKMSTAAWTPAAYQKAMRDWYLATSQKLEQGEIENYFVQLLKNRNAVFESEISKNPRGQIFEPGFRVIFPQPHGVPNRM